MKRRVTCSLDGRPHQLVTTEPTVITHSVAMPVDSGGVIISATVRMYGPNEGASRHASSAKTNTKRGGRAETGVNDLRRREHLDSVNVA